jgi:hypothetical protein
METMMAIDDAEVRFKGIVALNEALGPAGALRFLTLLHRDRTDYVEISRRLYEVKASTISSHAPANNGRDDICWRQHGAA